jgi:hypothetical protein
VALPQDDPKVRRPDISRARALLSFTPKVELRQGLLRTIAALERAIGREETSGVLTLGRRVRRADDGARSVTPLRTAKVGRSS